MSQLNIQSFVYMWINIVNGKAYIGSHIGHLNDGYIGSGRIFQKAVKKHGIEKFQRVILFIIDGKHHTLIRDQETFFINKINSFWKSGLYNIRLRGDCGNQLEIASERRLEINRRISLAKKGKSRPDLRKPKSEAHKKAIANALRGKKLTPERIKNISLSKIGKKRITNKSKELSEKKVLHSNIESINTNGESNECAT